MKGGAGLDLLSGGADADTLRGGGQSDELYGEDGADKLYGNAGFDILDGGEGDDRLFGGTWTDLLLGGAGHDVLDGGRQSDELWGGAGNDILKGGTNDHSQDFLNGGDGSDRFVFHPGGGDDIVADWVDADDLLNFSAYNFANKGSVLALADQVGADVIFSFASGQELLILNYDIAQLGNEDIII